MSHAPAPLGRMSAVLLLLCSATTLPAQSLATDKSDYLPGETVYLAGSGFQSGELVSIALKVENYTDTVLDYAVGGIVVDGAGDFTATWLVPQEALNTLITATAVGMTSGTVAETKFLDSHSGPYGLSVVGNTVTVEVLFVASPGFYRDQTSVVAYLTTTAGTTAVPLTRDSGGLPGVCCGPNAIGGGQPSHYSGSATFPSNTVVTFTGVNYQQFLGFTSGCFPFGRTGALVSPPLSVTTGITVCPTNSAPSLTLQSVDLGQVVGCLNGGVMTKDVTVAEGDFQPVATDADGDPVSVSFVGPTNFTFTGPGMVSGTVTFTVTDDPSARALPGCPLTPLTTTMTAQVSAQIVYAFDGPQAPLTAGQTLLRKVGRTIPLKFVLRDCTGAEVCPTNSPLFDTPAELPGLGVTAVTMMSPTGAPVLADAGASNDNGTSFRYEGTCGTDGKWIYNLSTGGAGWTAGVLYRADIALNDGTIRPVYFTLTK